MWRYYHCDLHLHEYLWCPYNKLSGKLQCGAITTNFLSCPINTTEMACQSQPAIDGAFASWLATATATGGCDGVLTNDNTGAPSACGGTTTVTFTYTRYLWCPYNKLSGKLKCGAIITNFFELSNQYHRNGLSISICDRCSLCIPAGYSICNRRM